MTRDHLQTVSERLESASAAASDDEAAERLAKQAERAATFATAERGPDHGQLAKMERIVQDVADDEGGEVADLVAEAKEHITAFRETVEGV